MRLSEEKFRNIFESANDCMVFLDTSGRILEVNGKAVELFGGPKEELLGKHFTRVGVLSPRDIPVATRAFAKILAGKKATVNTCIKNKKGQEIHVEVSASPMKTDGKLAGMLVIARDVTERKKAEEELRLLKEFDERVIDSLDDALLVIDPNDYTIITANEGALKQLKLRKEDLIGKTCYETTHHRSTPCKPPHHTCPIQEMLKTGKVVTVEHTHFDKDNKEIIVEVSARPLINPEGKIAQVVHLARDVTKARRSEEQARHLLEFQNKVIDTADVWINLIDKEGNVTLWNRAAELISGYSREEVIGHMDWEFEWLYPDPKYRAEIFAETKKIIETGERLENDETTIRCKDGTLKTISWYCNNILDEKGKPAGLISVGIDVTERKRFEERLSALNTYSRNLNMAGSMEEIYQLTLDAVEKTLGFEIAAFMVAGKDMLCVVDQRGFSESHSFKLPLNGTKGGVTVKAAKTGSPVLVPDTRKERAYVADVPGMRSELAVPVRAGHRVLGVLDVESERLNAFDEKDQKLLEILASHAATAMSNLEYAKNLEKLVQERTRELRETHERLLKSERLAAIGQLAAMVGHDLRNPLQAITNASYVINETFKKMVLLGKKFSFVPPPLRKEMFEEYA